MLILYISSQNDTFCTKQSFKNSIVHLFIYTYMYICYRYSFYKKDHCFFNNYCQHVFEKTDGVCKYVFSLPLHEWKAENNKTSRGAKAIKLHHEWKVESNKTSRFVKAITFQARKCNYASRWVNYSNSLQH